MAGDSKKLISIVCPVHNEEKAIPFFYNRLTSVIEDLRQRYNFELIFTNNASEDQTLDIIRKLHRKDVSVQVITLSRNFGYHASMTAGLRHATGSGIVIIDVDCEDPPEMIPKFIAAWEKGYDIVYGIRGGRPEFIGLQWARKAFYRITRLIADYDFILDMAEFSLISSHVRDAILSNDSTFPFPRTELAFVGFKRFGIPYNREPRVTGESHYNLIRMTQFAIGGILSTSTYPLRFAVYLGVPLVLINVYFLLVCLLAEVQTDFKIVYLLDLTYMLSTLVFLSIYLARIYKDGVHRPIFIVDWQNSILNKTGTGEHKPDERLWTTDRG